MSIYTKNLFALPAWASRLQQTGQPLRYNPRSPPLSKKGGWGDSVLFWEVWFVTVWDRKKRGDDLTSPLSRSLYGAEGGTWTRTGITHHPLKMACLPNSTTSAHSKVALYPKQPRVPNPFSLSLLCRSRGQGGLLLRYLVHQRLGSGGMRGQKGQ